MTTLYRPVLIESAEQAEALPEGTVATDPDVWPVEKFQDRWENDADRFDHGQMVGWTALVPIEAEEHVERHWCSFKCPGPHNVSRAIYRTPWEEA